MNPNGSADPRRELDPELLNAVEKAVEGRQPTGIPVVDDLAGMIPQADDTFRARLEDWLIATLGAPIKAEHIPDESPEHQTRSADMPQIMAREHHLSAYTQQRTPVYTLAAALMAVFVLIGVLISSSLATEPTPSGAVVVQQGPTLTMTPAPDDQAQIRITVERPGMQGQERLLLHNDSNQTINISDWTIELNGELIYTVPENRRVSSWGILPIYVGEGTDQEMTLFMGYERPLFLPDIHDELLIRDGSGTIRGRWLHPSITPTAIIPAPLLTATALIQQAIVDALIRTQTAQAPLLAATAAIQQATRAAVPTPTVSEFAMPPEPELRAVIIAVEPIAEGTTIEAGMVAVVYWPVDLAAELTPLTMAEVVGSIAEQDIARWMPLWESPPVDD